MTEALIKSVLEDLVGDGRLVDAPIEEVLVMEDRAQITRRAHVELVAGQQTLSCAPVAPLIADRTLRCRIRAEDGETSGGDGARILDVRVARHYLIRPTRPEAEVDINARIEEILDLYVEICDRLRALHHERGVLSAALQRLSRHIGERILVGPFESKWNDEARSSDERRAELEAQALEDQWAQDDRMIELDRLLDEKRLILQPMAEYRAAVTTELTVPTAGRYLVEWEYLVPCALWRPAYVAELERAGGGSKVHWRSGGTVWQFTGEDWSGVRLCFSTARPTLGAELPILSDDVLSSREKTDHEKKTIEVTSRDQVIAKTSTVPEAETSDTPPGLDDGGEARTYEVPERVDVPSDGRPHRIEFETWEVDTETELLCVPEKRCFVFLRSLQANPSSMPLLAGPVSLTRDGGFVGRSEISYVAPRERFGLSWGSEDGLVVLRDVARDYEETGLRKQRHHRFDIDIYVANHAGGDRTLRLMERVPISEIEQVEISIEDKKTTGGYERDAQGMVSWKLELPAGGEKKVRLVFEVRMPQNVHWNG